MAYHRQVVVNNMDPEPINDTNRSFRQAVVQPDGSAIRVVSEPGKDPTNTLGVKIFPGGFITINSNSEIAVTKIISDTATDSTVDMQFYE